MLGNEEKKELALRLRGCIREALADKHANCVFGGSLTILFGTLAFDSQTMTFSLKHNWSHKALNLGSLKLGLLAFLDGHGFLDHVLANIVVFCQVKQLADF